MITTEIIIMIMIMMIMVALLLLVSVRYLERIFAHRVLQRCLQCVSLLPVMLRKNSIPNPILWGGSGISNSCVKGQGHEIRMAWKGYGMVGKVWISGSAPGGKFNLFKLPLLYSIHVLNSYAGYRKYRSFFNFIWVFKKCVQTSRRFWDESPYLLLDLFKSHKRAHLFFQKRIESSIQFSKNACEPLAILEESPYIPLDLFKSH